MVGPLATVVHVSLIDNLHQDDKVDSENFHLSGEPRTTLSTRVKLALTEPSDSSKDSPDLRRVKSSTSPKSDRLSFACGRPST